MTAASRGPSLDTRAIWAIALPAMATNVATALLGVADIWVIGQLGEPAVQGATEVGARLLMGLLVVFNFLKTATTGLTAQAAGRRSEDERLAILVRASAAALAIGLALYAAKSIVVPLGLDFLEADGAVRANAALYVDIRYWAAPAWLMNAALVGWLIGLRRVRAVLAVEVAINLVHIGLDALLVLGLSLGIAGVAYATLASELLKLALLLAIVLPLARPRALAETARHGPTWTGAALLHLVRVNRDLFLRTLVLTFAILLVTRAGAQQGAVVLATNAIVFQLFMVATLLLDGFENSAQVLAGERYGARDRRGLMAVTHAIQLRGFAVAVAVSLLFAALGAPIAASFSTDPAVDALVREYVIWLWLLPLAGVASYIYDGVFVGAAWTRAMLLTMLGAFIIYAPLLLLAPGIGNHALWFAFMVFLVARAILQALILPRLVARDFRDSVAAKGDMP